MLLCMSRALVAVFNVYRAFIFLPFSWHLQTKFSAFSSTTNVSSRFSSRTGSIFLCVSKILEGLINYILNWRLLWASYTAVVKILRLSRLSHHRSSNRVSRDVSFLLQNTWTRDCLIKTGTAPLLKRASTTSLSVILALSTDTPDSFAISFHSIAKALNKH